MKIIFFLLLLSFSVFPQWGGWGRPVQSLTFVDDSTELKSFGGKLGRVVMMKYYDSTKKIGGGTFVLVDSVSGHPNHVYSFSSATTGRHWQRWETLIDSATIKADWSGIKGDFSGLRADTAARGNDESKLQAMINTGKRIKFPNNASYWISTGDLDFSNKSIVADGGLTIYSSNNGTNGAIYAKGSVSATSTTLTSDLGGKYDDKDNDMFNVLDVTSTTGFTAGDIILISSDSTRGSVNIGEQGQIDTVLSSTKLILKSSVHSYYTTANNAQIEKINTVTFSMQGEVFVKFLGRGSFLAGTSGGGPVGAVFEYVEDLNIEKLYSSDFIARGIVVSHCYKPIVSNSMSTNSVQSGLGYNFAFAGSNTGGRFTDLYGDGGRHCVSFGAGTGRGIAFDCVVSGTFHGKATSNPAGGTWVLDAHVEAGSVIWEDCNVKYYGAASVDTVTIVAGGGTGFNLGADQNTIKNCIVKGVQDGISMRASVSSVNVSGLEIIDGVGRVYSASNTFTTDSLSLINVVAPNMALLFISNDNGGVSHIDIDGARVKMALEISGVGKTGMVVDDIIDVNNVRCKTPFSIDLSSNDVTPDTFGVKIDDWDSFEALRFNNCSFENFTEAIYLNNSTLERLIINNSFFDNNRMPVRLSSGAFDKVVVSGNTFLRQYTGTSNLGVIHYDAVGTAIDSICFYGNTFDGPRIIFVVGSNPGAVDFFWGDNVVATSNFLSRFNNTSAVTNQFGADYKDDTQLKFGDSDDFVFIMDGTSTELRLRDSGSNNFLQIADAGTDGTFEFTGKIGIGKTPGTVFDLQDNSAHANTAYLNAYQINDAAGIMCLKMNSLSNTLGNSNISATADGGIVQLNRVATGSGALIDFKLDNVSQIRITPDGNFLVGTTTDPSANDGKVLVFGDNTNDPTMGSNTAGVYAKDVSGTVEIYTIDEAGNTAQQTPHDPSTGKWIFYSKNIKTGRVLRVEMEELVFDVAKMLRGITGKKYIYEEKE